jgi:benzoate-CoA ligase family protein
MTEPFNAANYLVDRHLTQGNGDRIAATGPDGSLTYAELAQQVATASAGWRAAGLRPEERVLLYASDGPDLLVALLSLLRCGAVPVPVSTLYRGTDLAVLLRDARARFLVAGAEHVEQAGVALADRSADLHAVVTIGDTALDHPDGVRVLGWHRDVLGSTAETGPADHVTEDSPALWLYTSGTTGTPKAAMHRHGSIRFVAEAYGRDVLGIGRDDRCFSAAKLSFAYGLGNSCFLPLAAGATTVLAAARPTPEALAERLVTDRPTLFFAVPTVFAALLRAGDLPDDVFASVRVAVSAGEALPAELQRRFSARFGVDLVNGLGTTETLHIFLSNRPGRTRPGSVGSAVPGYEVRVLTDGRPASPGQPGALQVKAPSAASGYWARAEATARVFQGEWVATGDLCVHDEDGYYTCLGRTTDMIKAGGLWVSPVEVEAHLLTHPDVAEAAVIAAPDLDGLDEVVACVVPTAGRHVDPVEFIAFCGKELPAFKRPRRVLRFDTLPTNTTGKLQRRVLRELVIEQRTSRRLP